jgi:hypothetical protein
MLNLKTVISVMMLIFISGCSVQSSQLSGLLSLVKEPGLDLSENSWLLRYSGYEAVVYAVSINDKTLFSNNVGDQVLFDGWIVREIRGLGRRGLDIKIDDNDGVRTFKRGAGTLAGHNCKEWQRELNLNMIKLSQHCGGKREYTNSILVLENGSISVIRQIVDERYTALTLTKLE